MKTNSIIKAMRITRKNDAVIANANRHSLERAEKKKKILHLHKENMKEADSERQMEIILMLAALDRTARNSKVKCRRRCKITGRPRGVTTFGVCSGHLRLHASFGNINGVLKK
jgi:ribosomal protein S14